MIIIIVNRLPASHNSGDDISTGSGDHQWETKSRFTEYSITSSVVPRSEGIYSDCVCTRDGQLFLISNSDVKVSSS